MLSKCANPSCDAPFRYLRDGRLFQVERRGAAGISLSGHNVEHYWLCAACAQRLTLVRKEDGSVQVIPLALEAA